MRSSSASVRPRSASCAEADGKTRRQVADGDDVARADRRRAGNGHGVAGETDIAVRRRRDACASVQGDFDRRGQVDEPVPGGKDRGVLNECVGGEDDVAAGRVQHRRVDGQRKGGDEDDISRAVAATFQAVDTIHHRDGHRAGAGQLNPAGPAVDRGHHRDGQVEIVRQPHAGACFHGQRRHQKIGLFGFRAVHHARAGQQMQRSDAIVAVGQIDRPTEGDRARGAGIVAADDQRLRPNPVQLRLGQTEIFVAGQVDLSFGDKVAERDDVIAVGDTIAGADRRRGRHGEIVGVEFDVPDAADLERGGAVKRRGDGGADDDVAIDCAHLGAVVEDSRGAAAEKVDRDAPRT